MRKRDVIQIMLVLAAVFLVAYVGGLRDGAYAAGDLDCAESGTRGIVQWDRYIDSDGSIEERPDPKAGFDTVRLTICNDGTVRGRIDRTAPRR